jgi:phosphatidylserine/phosphatidylglycerophosphate/cardiolipin synthase-like enzyme
MRQALFGAWLLLLAAVAGAQIAEHPVISELRFYETSGVNEEFVEIYNPTPFAIDIGGWRLQYAASSLNNWTDKVLFETGRQIGPRGFLLYGGTACEVEPDYPTPVNPGLGNTGGHVRLIDAQSNEIDRVGWLAATGPEGSAIGEAHPRGGSYERKASASSTAASLQPGGAEALDGNGWDSDNNAADFVLQPVGMSGPQNSDSPPEPDEPLTDGSGTAVCSITQVFAPGPVDFDLTVSAGEHLLATVVVELPEGWSAAGAELSGAGFDGAQLDIDGRFFTVSGATVDGGDTGTFSFDAVTVGSQTQLVLLSVRTAVEGGIPALIAQRPAIQVIGDPIPISDLNENDASGLPLLMGQQVVIRGVVTAGGELGAACYMQDGTAGTVCYDWSFAEAVEIGDEVSVVGTVVHFNGLTELTPATVLELHATGQQVEPTLLSCADIANQGAGGEPWQGMLVRLPSVLVQGSGNWAGNTNYAVSDASGSTVLRITAGTDLIGTPIPAGRFDLIGVVGQYDFSPPYHSGYQVLPRFELDIVPTAGPGLSGGPWEDEHGPDSVRLSWTTRNPGSTIIVWGHADGGQIDSLHIAGDEIEHAFTIEGLDPGTPYWARIGSANEDGASMSGDYWFSTVSVGSPGTIQVFFTQSVDHGYALPGNEANGSHDVLGEVLALINGAQVSLDMAIYSLNITAVSQAVIAAHDRGVAVRFVYDSDHDQGAVAQIANAGVPVIDNSFGNRPGSGIQHNKVLIVDARDEDPANDRVWTGSLNLIDQPSGYGVHAKQNSLLIADQAVARAFTLEFEEMWGSSTLTPNPAQSRFGEHKRNNTPHYFLVGGRPLEVWFSPGDNVSQRIVNYLGEATESVYFCVLVFTRNEIGYAMRDAHQDRGAAVRGVFDTTGDQYSVWNTLLGWGADIHVDVGSGILHHKYMLIDQEEPGLDPTVITGSYNWSNSAEQINDENIVVIHDRWIANQYLQEFAERYHTAGGAADFTAVGDLPERPLRFSIEAVYPNPFNPVTTLRFVLPEAGETVIGVYDLLGRQVLSRPLGWLPAGSHAQSLDLSHAASGLYLLRLESQGRAATAKALLVK